MSLIKCPECSNQISSQASSCPKCGWKVASFKWWLWIPLGGIGLFIVLAVIGNMEPKYKTQAREVRNACEKIASPTQLGECDRIYNKAIADGEKASKQKTDGMKKY